MAKLNAEGMQEVQDKIKARKEMLGKLMSKPFDLANSEQLAAIKKYIDNFELSLNRMYLFQGLYSSTYIWGASWFVSLVLPIPDFMNYFLSTFLYFGTAGYILDNFNTTDFYNDLEEMKVIYNWALKGGNNTYEGTSNIEKLNHPDIQRMVKLLAPLCTVDFILAWDKITNVDAPSSGLGTIFNVGQKIYGRFFSSVPEASDKLRVLLAQVETGELKMNTLMGLEQSMRYFTTNTTFKALMMTKVQAPIDYVKEKLPDIVTSNLYHLKMN